MELNILKKRGEDLHGIDGTQRKPIRIQKGILHQYKSVHQLARRVDIGGGRQQPQTSLAIGGGNRSENKPCCGKY